MFHLFERQCFVAFLGCSRLPHTDSSAGSSSDDQFWVWTDGAEDLTPLCQTLIDHQSLKTKTVILQNTQKHGKKICTRKKASRACNRKS